MFYSSSNMPRMSSGAWGWPSFSEGGVGDWGFVAESGMAVSSRGPSSVGSGSSRVVLVVVGSGVMWVSVGVGPSYLASVVFATSGASSWSLGVGTLFFMAAKPSCS